MTDEIFLLSEIPFFANFFWLNYYDMSSNLWCFDAFNLKAPVSVETEYRKRRLIANKIGTPQGGVCSRLLANIYMNDFCLKIANRTPCKIVTYADDCVILHEDTFTSEQRKWLSKELASEGLTLNEDKTHHVDMTKLGSEFYFPGFNFKQIKGFYRGGKIYQNSTLEEKSEETQG